MKSYLNAVKCSRKPVTRNNANWKYWTWLDCVIFQVKVESINMRPKALMESFSTVSKVIQDCIGFASLRSVIGQDNSRHSLNQSDAKLKTNHDGVARVFPRFRQLGVLTLNPRWLFKPFVFFLSVTVSGLLVLVLWHPIEMHSKLSNLSLLYRLRPQMLSNQNFTIPSSTLWPPRS